jgi:hypothetical protein
MRRRPVATRGGIATRRRLAVSHRLFAGRRASVLLAGPLALAALLAPCPPVGGSAQAAEPAACADTLTETITETPGHELKTESSSPSGAPGSLPGGRSCWVDEQPYPFGSDGEPVTSATEPECLEALRCYLTVTSMAFRAWNRGLAATKEPISQPGEDPYPIWIFNGTSWFPDPTFIGQKTCPGGTIVWAGKKDYWLIGGKHETTGEEKWAKLCRFDGVKLEWEPLELPEATATHIKDGAPKWRSGQITSAACFAWNDCWFFGTYGVVVHWDGKEPLIDASPSTSDTRLQGEYTGALAQVDTSGNPFGFAIGATSEFSEEGRALSTNESAPPAQLYGSSGAGFSPLPFAPPTVAQPKDPFRTDLVAVGFEPGGLGWVAGNPAGLRAKYEANDAHPEPPSSRGFLKPEAQPSPLLALSRTGEPSVTCKGPPSGHTKHGLFTYTPEEGQTEPGGAFLWSSLAAFPASGEALAGGRMRPPRAAPSVPAVAEPVVAQVGCQGSAMLTRFRTAGDEPSDGEGTATAVAATANNDAWAATSEGESFGSRARSPQRPHLYRLTNGRPPEAPEGNDEEPPRPRETTEEPPIFVFEPAPAPPPPPPALTVTQTPTVTLPPAVFGVKVKLHRTKRHGHIIFSLYLTFKLRRPITIGAQALRHGRVVSVARHRRFAGKTGVLILQLDRRRWPTQVRFVA